jgi:transposase InsO family protein
MELSMSERRAVTKVIATRYARSGRAVKKQILDELCATTGWHRDHAHKALRQALVLKAVRPGASRPPLYGEPVIEALRFCWAVQGTPCGRLLAAALPDLVPRLRRFQELTIEDGTAALLLKIVPATIDRRLKADRRKLDPKGRSHTKPGTLLKDTIPMRTWASGTMRCPVLWRSIWSATRAAIPLGEFCFTLTITDICTGWTETGSVRNKAQKWVFAAINEATAEFPFPVVGIESDNGSEFINWELLRWCEQEQLTFTRSRSGNKNDGAHMEQNNWHVVRQTVGYHRYGTGSELELLSRIWALQGQLTNHFGPQQKLVQKIRTGAKITKKYDLPATPYERVLADEGTVRKVVKAKLKRENKPLNPAAIPRQVQALCSELLTLTTAKQGPRSQPTIRAQSNDSSIRATRAS